MTKYKLDTEIELIKRGYCNGCPLCFCTKDNDYCVVTTNQLKYDCYAGVTWRVRDSDCPLSMVDEYAEVEKESLKEYERFTE